jgi:YD repeat-containing protein
MPPAASFLTRPVVELLGRHQGYGFAGIGVSTAIGNFTQTTADLTFGPGLLGLLDWQRTYNSHSGAIGALGPGWTTSFSARLVAPPPEGLLHHTASPVTFFDEDGRVLTFTPAASGGFTRPQDLAADLTRNADGSFSLAYNCGKVWSFDATGRLTGRSLEGQQVSLAYDGSDLLVRAEDSSGHSLAFSYDANRRLTSVQASDGRVVSFGYGAGTVTDSLLESVTVPGGGVFAFESSGSGQAAQISKITDPGGDLVVANVYDTTTAEITSQQYGGGASAAFSYNGTGGTTVTSDPGGAQVVFQADPSGRMVKVTDAGGNTATFGYDSNGYLTQATTPGGTTLTQTHDAQGNLLTSTFDDSTTTWTYDSADRVTSVTGPTGDRTSFAYTGSSRIPSQITNANGGLIQAEVSNGLVTSRTNADGGTTSYGYDAARNLISVTGPLGEQVRLAYDAAGYLTQVVAPSGATRQWARDGAGRVTSYTAQDGTVTGFRYSAAGLLLERTDPGGASTLYGYDAAGNRTSITDALGNQTTFGYDALGNLITSTNAAGDVVTYAYNALGQLITVTDPVDAVAEFRYDPDGNNVATVTPAGGPA